MKNASSPEYKDLEEKVVKTLLPELKKKLPVQDLEVTNFKAGSVIAEYKVIFIVPAAESVNSSRMETALHSVVSTVNFTGLNVNRTFLPPVQGKTLSTILFTFKR